MKIDRTGLKKIILEALNGQMMDNKTLNGETPYGTSMDTQTASDVSKAISALKKIVHVFPGHEEQLSEFVAFLEELDHGSKPRPRTGLADSPMR